MSTAQGFILWQSMRWEGEAPAEPSAPRSRGLPSPIISAPPLPAVQVRAADLVLVCSRIEGFGRATAEGMLAGKPVVGADNTATAELIHDGSNGLLYRTADAHDLACKIDYLYCHPETAWRLGRNGQTWAKRVFTRDRYRDEILPLLNELLPAAAWRVAL